MLTPCDSSLQHGFNAWDAGAHATVPKKKTLVAGELK